MKSLQVMMLVATLALVGCEDEPLNSRLPAEPVPPGQGAQAFMQVDNETAQPGEEIGVYVRVQLGEKNQSRIGSYTGRLKFDTESLEWVSDQPINDGLRVTNPAGAGGEVRFAGASATGFNDLLLYAGRFRVKDRRYAAALALEMQELSAATTLGDMTQQLRVAPQVFLRSAGN